MVGKLKHSWPDSGSGGNDSSASPPKPVGKLTTGSAFSKPSPSSANSSPFSNPPSAGNTPAKSPVKKWTPASSPEKKWTPPQNSAKTNVSTPPSKVKGVRITGGAFTAKMESDRGVAEAFIEGDLVVDGGEVSLKAVAENLSKDNFLEKLVLRNCEVDDDFVTRTLAKNLRQIVHLNLSKNDLSEESQMALITGALMAKVEVIHLSQNKQIGKANCDMISELMEDNHCISEFVAEFEEKPANLDMCIERNRQVTGYFDRIKRANSALEMVTRRLSVRDNDLVRTMIKAEENDPTVREINIFQDPRFGHIQNTIVVGFAEGLRTNLNLKKLTMKGLDLGNVFLSGLAASIEWNFTLELVDLANNAFTSDGISEFCQAMALNQSIQKVDLRHQHSPVFSHSEEIVVNALEKNYYVKEFDVEFKTPGCGDKVKAITERNKSESKTIDYDMKLIEFLRQEANIMEELAEQRKEEAKPLDIPDDDWEYFFELEQLAHKFKFRFKEGDHPDGPEEAAPTERQTIRKNLNSRRRPSRSVSDLGGMSKSVNISAVRFTGDGAFLTEEFITSFIRDSPEDQSVTFDFSCQFKMFKRFPVESPDRAFIVGKFADVLLEHPRCDDLTHINMSNCFLGNDWVVYFCEKCLSNPKLLPKLNQFNLETNFISESGVVAVSKCIASHDAWRHFQVVKLENQKFLLSSKAENELAKALYVNRSVITVNLRVRNIHERTRIEKYVYRNIDLMRQARRKHKIKTGTLKERKRNKVEQFFDNVTADDPSITEVELIGDQIFLSLNAAEKLKAAKSFATNKHITKVKMTLLKLDDMFGIELGKSLKDNSTIEQLILESNNFTGEAIKAIVGCLSKNSTILELQLRHQGKNMASSDESQLAGLMGDNKTVVKFGVDIRHMQAKNDVERKLRHNQDLARKNRRKTPGRTKSSEEFIKKVNTQKILERVIKGDKEVKAVILNSDQEFIKMEGFRKKEFYEGLKTNSVVTILTMNDVQLDNEFGDVLISILDTNSTIESISINKNYFTSLGVFTIVDAVIKKKQIRKLSILKPRAKISNDEAERLLEALEKESYIQELNIDFRDSALADRLKKVLESNKAK